MEVHTPKRPVVSGGDSSANKRAKLGTSSMDDKIMDFGKHRTQTYSWVYQHDVQYCDWALREQQPYGKLSAFAQYVRMRRAQPANASPGSSATARQDKSRVPQRPVGHLVEFKWDGYVSRGYCFHWLEDGMCMGCQFKHEYPPEWSAAERELHKKYILWPDEPEYEGDSSGEESDDSWNEAENDEEWADSSGFGRPDYKDHRAKRRLSKAYVKAAGQRKSKAKRTAKHAGV